MKKMLLIHPNNFLQGGMGENNRVIELVNLFKELGFEIDHFGFENFSPNTSFENFEQQNQNGIIRKLFLYDFQKGYSSMEHPSSPKINLLKEKFKKKIKEKLNKQFLQDWVPFGAQRMFDDILKENKYDVIVIFYTYLASLFQNRNIDAQKIYFMEDSMFLQQYSWEKGSVEGITLGKLMDEEIERMKLFDKVFCISNDERIFYEKITGKNMYFLPHLLPVNFVVDKKPIEKRRWDIYFIGFDNPFNVEGLDWFLEEVYPLLSKNIKIVLVGSATKHIENKYFNVDIIPFAPSLEDIYADVKIAICPMFQGTGMKVKVVEAMAQGFPIVCNERGVDGLPDKTMCGCLVTQDAHEFALYLNRLVEDEKFYALQRHKIETYYQQIFDRNLYVNLLDRELNK